MFMPISDSFEPSGIFGQTISQLSRNKPVLSALIYSTGVFLNAILLNRMVIINRVAIKITLVPGAVYVVLASVFPPLINLTTLLFTSFFLILIFTNLSYAGIRFKVEDRIFNIGFFAGLASLMYPPAILYIMMIYLGLSMLRTYKQKENLNALNGFLLPHFFAFVYFFLADKSGAYFQLQFREGFGFLNIGSFSSMEMIYGGILVVIAIFGAANYPSIIKKKEIQSRKKIDLMYWSLFFGLLILIFAPQWHLQLAFLFLPGLAFLLAESLLLIKSEPMADLIFVLLIIMSFVFQFIPSAA